MADKPTVHLSLAKVRKEVEKPEPFGVGLSNSKIVTFPDLFAMESVEAEEIFASLNQTSTNWTILRRWLPEDDANALKAEKLSVRELATVVQAAVKYYEDAYGESGNGSASAS
ncbi:hypothetical protein [Arthrobacter sp. USHLN218]|uniref:hypothetical protein n=1 Tax=Arthrobacter sp. USHLN218 TaxID=3081232 RepID=UPI0030190986